VVRGGVEPPTFRFSRDFFRVNLLMQINLYKEKEWDRDLKTRNPRECVEGKGAEITSSGVAVAPSARTSGTRPGGRALQVGLSSLSFTISQG
jgi:hypothetical protein